MACKPTGTPMHEPRIALFRLCAGDLCLGSAIIPTVYDELPEFRAGGTLIQVSKRMVDATEQLDRHEILAVLDGVLIGFACLVEEDDMHVGRCLTLQWQYVVPEHRDRIGGQFLRWLAKAGRDMGFQFIAYSHRISSRHYAIKYRSVHHGQEGQETRFKV